MYRTYKYSQIQLQSTYPFQTQTRGVSSCNPSGITQSLYRKIILGCIIVRVGCGSILIEVNVFLFIVANGYIKKLPRIA